jgi:cold shock CspA family protein
MRFEGRLKSWNDERGFGFVEPLQSDEDVFVHIKAFRVLVGRPQVGQPLSFEIELGPQGRKAGEELSLRRPLRTKPREYRELCLPSSFFATNRERQSSGRSSGARCS